MKLIVLVFTLILSGCISPQNGKNIREYRINRLLKILPGKTSEAEVKAILGEPEKTYFSNTFNKTVLEYDLVNIPKHNMNIPRTKVFINPKNKLVTSYRFSPFDGKKFGFKDVQSIFPGANLVAEPIDYKKHHYIPQTQVFKDSQIGLGFEYRKHDDTAFGFSVSIPNNTQAAAN